MAPALLFALTVQTLPPQVTDPASDGVLNDDRHDSASIADSFVAKGVEVVAREVGR